jgi:hypothetical protein
MSGGFEPKPKLYELVWGSGGYEGLEVTAKGVSTGAFLEIQELAEGMGDQPKAADVKRLLKRFGGLLTAWNITDNGEPVPADYEHLAELDVDLAMEIFGRWSQAVGGVDPTSPAGSGGGGTSPGAPPPGLASASQSLSP